METLKNTTKEGNTGRVSAMHYDMIVFCHLRWELVYQRPQHIISRMARKMNVLVVEEPIHFDEDQENSANLVSVSSTLHVLRPRVRDIQAIRHVIKDHVPDMHARLGWFCSASFVSLLDYLSFDTIIYDCMDELSSLKGAPRQDINKENFLMANADIVFTGGKSLYESKKKRHANVHCFPSSVDEPHFAQARNGIALPSDIAQVKWPIVGYFGVIDERIDLELLRESAYRLPDVSFVMIGPLTKIDDIDLPKAHNIHYLGMKSYNELPGYLKAFDIAMMPFAINDATKFICPTRMLEYMAAGKPIISTCIRDVVRDYSHCVQLASTAEDFCEGIAQIFNKKVQQVSQYAQILKNTSWDDTVAKMSAIIKQSSL